MSKFTFSFQEIFPDEATFESFVAEYCDDVGDVTAGEAKQFCAYAHRTLVRYFWGREIAYDDPQMFLFRFSQVYNDRMTWFQAMRKHVQTAQGLTDEDIVLIGETLSNNAGYPNSEPEDPRKPLKYVTDQVFSMTTSGKLRAYLDAINNMPIFRSGAFIRARMSRDEMTFEDLFLPCSVQNDPIFFDIKED